MKKGTRIATISLVSIFVLLSVGMGWTYSFLRSEAGSQWLLRYLNQYLAQKQQLHLQYQRASIDPFSGVQFEGLELSQDLPAQKMTVKLEKFKLHFRVLLFSRTFEIDQFQVDRPEVSLHSSGNLSQTVGDSTPPNTTTAKAKPSEPLDLRKLGQLISSPWIRIRIPEVRIQQMKLDLDYSMSGSKFRTQVKDGSFILKFIWEKDGITSTGAFDLGQASPVYFSKNEPHLKTTLSFTPAARAHWDIQMKKEKQGWVYRFQPAEMQLGIQNVLYSQSSTQASSQVKLGSLEFQSHSKLTARTSDFLRFNEKSWEEFKMEHRLQLEKLVHDQVSIQSQTLSLIGNISENIQFWMNSDTYSLSLSSIPSKIPGFYFKGEGQLTRNLDQLKFQAGMDTLPVQATQKNIPFFHTDLKLKAGSQLEFSSNSQFMMNSALMKALRGLGGLGKLAQLQAEVHLKSQTAVRALSFFELDPSQLKESVTQGQFQVGAKQAVKNGVLTPIGEVNLAGQFTSRLPKFTLDGKLKIQDEEALHFKNYAEVKEKGIQLSSTFDYRTGKYLAKILPEGQIKKFGNWSGKTQLEMKTENPESESSSLKKVGQLQVSTTTRWTQDQPGLGFSNTPQLIFDQPIVLEQSLDLNQGVTQVQLKGTVPSIQIQDFGKIDGTELNFSLHSPDTQFKEKVEVQLNLAQGQIHLDPKWAAPLGKKEPLHGLQVSLKAMAPFENRFVLNQFVADFNHSMVRLEAEATGNTLTKNSQSKGALRLNIPKNYPSWNGQSFSGKVEFPWILSISKGQNMHFEGNMTLDNVNWSKPLLQVVGIQGKIPVSEDLILQNPGMKFAYLITQNPFERVDYERLQPMIHETEQLKIGQIHVEEKVLGPFQGYFSVQQNRLSAHKFDFNLGSGKSHGEIYFDVLPVNMQFGILSRLTGIQLDEVVPESILKGHTSDHQALSGRTGLVFNLTQGTMDGRMDITEIGQRQLLTMINILDPNYVNEQMNRARFALGIAYPSRVEMAFQKGYLDMNVQMKGLISQRIDVHGIPVNAWVSGAASEIAKKGREVPLQ